MKFYRLRDLLSSTILSHLHVYRSLVRYNDNRSLIIRYMTFTSQVPNQGKKNKPWFDRIIKTSFQNFSIYMKFVEGSMRCFDLILFLTSDSFAVYLTTN